MGNLTCMGYPGTTLNKVKQDAQTFAEWKVDMLKLDGCFSTQEDRAKGEFCSQAVPIRGAQSGSGLVGLSQSRSPRSRGIMVPSP